jgi:hypothetical protein
VEGNGKGRRLDYHEETSFSRCSPINICPENWRQNPQMMEMAAIQREAFTMYDGWKRVERARKEIFEPVAGI